MTVEVCILPFSSVIGLIFVGDHIILNVEIYGLAAVNAERDLGHMEFLSDHHP
jgi:hypothetical protein